MFRHYRVILRELVINTLPSYTSISNAAVGTLRMKYDETRRNQISSFVKTDESI